MLALISRDPIIMRQKEGKRVTLNKVKYLQKKEDSMYRKKLTPYFFFFKLNSTKALHRYLIFHRELSISNFKSWHQMTSFCGDLTDHYILVV